jgi:hypothetical protein
MQGYVKFIRIKLNAKRGLLICGGGVARETEYRKRPLTPKRDERHNSVV